MKATLQKVKSVHNNLRLDYYTGSFDQPPTIGKSFIMNTREEGMLYTTPVLSYAIRFPEKTITFLTKHSTYELTLEG